ncbi:MAG: SH3 domain-containing protein [Patescibacteria group bacterium]
MRYTFLAFTVLAGFLSLASPSHAMETSACNTDPVYTRNMNGRAISAAYIRTQPCMTESAILATLPANAAIQIIGETDGWYKVQSGTTIGWVGARLIRVVNTPVIVTPVKPTTTTATTAFKKPIGVSERDFAKLRGRQWSLVQKLRNKVIIRPQAKGELYFVNKYGVLKQFAASQLATYLQLSTNGALTLKATTNERNVKLAWSTEGLEAPNGFKVVMATHANPIYPGDEYHYLTDASAREHLWEALEPGRTYHFRVCQYLSGSCGVYSNNIAVRISSKTGTPTPIVTANNGTIALTGYVGTGNVVLNWSVNNMISKDGFKIITATTANPVYPGNEYHYNPSADVRQDIWGGLSSGIHHFRVCEYKNGRCGVYSNDLVLITP